MRDQPPSKSPFKKQYTSFGRIDPAPFTALEFIAPVFLAQYMSILIPTIAYIIVFNFTSVYLTVEIPSIFGPKFEFNPQQLGLQFLGMIIGSLVGELLGGHMSDLWMNRRAKKLGERPIPEYRLWLIYFGYLTAMVGLIVFGVRTEQAPRMHWNVTPIVGIGIAAFGNQLVTTIVMTYVVDSRPERSASIGVFVNLFRSTWGFIGPFFFPDMYSSLGGSGASGLMVGIIAVCSVIPTIWIQWYEPSRKESHKTILD